MLWTKLNERWPTMIAFGGGVLFVVRYVADLQDLAAWGAAGLGALLFVVGILVLLHRRDILFALPKRAKASLDISLTEKSSNLGIKELRAMLILAHIRMANRLSYLVGECIKKPSAITEDIVLYFWVQMKWWHDDSCNDLRKMSGDWYLMFEKDPKVDSVDKQSLRGIKDFLARKIERLEIISQLCN